MRSYVLMQCGQPLAPRCGSDDSNLAVNTKYYNFQDTGVGGDRWYRFESDNTTNKRIKHNATTDLCINPLYHGPHTLGSTAARPTR